MSRWGPTDLAALQRLHGIGRRDGVAELLLRLAQQGDHVAVGVVAVLHHLVRLHRLVQDAAEVGALCGGEKGGQGRDEELETWS